MATKIKATNFDLTPSVQTAIEKKIQPLLKLVPAKMAPIELGVEVGKMDPHHQKGDIFRAEVNLVIKGEVLRAESAKEDIFMAINDVKDKMQILIAKFKTKAEVAKRGQRKAKEKIREV